MKKPTFPPRHIPILPGTMFGRWKVLRRGPNDHQGHATWRCKCQCGTRKTIVASILRKYTQSCGCLQKEIASKFMAEHRKGVKNPGWRGGKFKHKDGYIWVRVPNHPAASRGYVREHRVVMEKKIGRFLLPWENIHHKNGVRSDNRISNLELWVRKQPPGQRSIDLVRWAKFILKTYAPQFLVQ